MGVVVFWWGLLLILLTLRPQGITGKHWEESQA